MARLSVLVCQHGHSAVATHLTLHDRFGNYVCFCSLLYLVSDRAFEFLCPDTLVLGAFLTQTHSFIANRSYYSVQRRGMVEIIANDQGHRITPSWVSFTDEERLYAPT